MAELKSKFRNTSKGTIGAVQLNHEDKAVGIAIPPKGEVWLSEKEQVLTANAPRNESDNPFGNGSLTLVVRSSDVAHSRPIGDLQEPEQDPQPAPDPEPQPGEDTGEEELREEAPPAPEPAPPPEPEEVVVEDGEPAAPPEGFRPSERSAQPPPEQPQPPAPKAPAPKPPAD